MELQLTQNSPLHAIDNIDKAALTLKIGISGEAVLVDCFPVVTFRTGLQTPSGIVQCKCNSYNPLDEIL
jgi:hypothetical protein